MIEFNELSSTHGTAALQSAGAVFRAVARPSSVRPRRAPVAPVERSQTSAHQLGGIVARLESLLSKVTLPKVERRLPG